MRSVSNILVIQTAFIGDVILALPLIQVIKEYFAHANIDVVLVPKASELLKNHPAVREVIVYDKYGNDRGWRGFWKTAGKLRENRYELAIIPHRSLRSALLAMFAGIPLRIGFKKGIAQVLHTKAVRYQDEIHEIERNLSLLTGIGIEHTERVLPNLYPSSESTAKIEEICREFRFDTTNLIAIAPGTIWNTKRWLKERFAEVAKELVKDGFRVVLVGGAEDRELCEEIVKLAGGDGIVSTAGRLSLMESSELIRRCNVMICNDSAPMHLAVAMRTPVVAIFGATVPEFGFAPYGRDDVIVETRGLRCRPCSIHGGHKCPIETFDCMKNISADKVLAKVSYVLEKSGRERKPSRNRHSASPREG
ncbi:MAG TPA: lipopolysaccharide heptosyltransferase II [Bacteroidota bacterium]|nr:lipopolysaccharide heptosyltransferase II [Bacteroidota bacterium]